MGGLSHSFVWLGIWLLLNELEGKIGAMTLGKLPFVAIRG